MQPEPYRLIALGVHLANVVLVYGLVRRVAGDKLLAALIAALVLAFHPRQHESVIWLSALTWPAGTVFSLVAAYCYVVWRQSRQTVVALALIWAVLMLPQIAIKVRDWHTASQITTAVRDETLERYPATRSGGFFYIGLPDTVNRCVVWTYGIDSAVRLWYNNPRVYARKDVEFGMTNTPAPTDNILDFSARW